MIITIKGADFSSANIGTLSTYIISKSIGSGASFDIPNYVDKNSSVNWVITLNDGYTFGTYSVTMGGEVITPSVVDNVMTISIAEVTGNVRIVVATVNENTGEEDGSDDPVVPPVEPDEPENPDTTINAGLTLYQGYVDNKTVNDELNTRVKTEALVGPFEIEVNDGYLIRAMYEYSSPAVSNGGNLIVSASDAKTYHKYTGQQYVYITFCKTDATQALSPTEDIVKMFNTDIEDNPATDGVEVNGIAIELGQLLDSGLKENNARAYTVQNVNDKTTITTTGDYVMIPTYDEDDDVTNGLKTFYTNSSTNAFQTSSSGGSLKYHSTINVADLESAAPGKIFRIMFKRNDGNTIDLTELQSSLTII